MKQINFYIVIFLENIETFVQLCIKNILAFVDRRNNDYPKSFQTNNSYINTYIQSAKTKKKQRTDTKKYAKRIKSDNFTRSNREKSNIAIAILEKLMIGWHHNFFGGSNK